MDAELREYLEAMEQRLASRTDIETLVGELRILRVGQERLEARMDAQAQLLRTDMAAMEQRLIENIQGRREDIDAAFGDINTLRRAVQDHERRIDTLERRGG